MIFLEVDKGVSEWHQVCTEAVAGGTMASFSPATASGKGKEVGGKRMYQVSQGQKERLYKDGIGQYLGALILGVKGIVHHYGVQQDI